MFRKGDSIDSIIIVQSGTLEILTQIDSFDFTIAKLEKGAVLNYRNIFFKGERMNVSIKCSSRANLILLTKNELFGTANEEKELNSRLLHFTNKLHKLEKKYMIDYLPSHECNRNPFYF